MYVPDHFAMDGPAVQDLLLNHGAGDLVTATSQGLLVTLLPFVYDSTQGVHGALLGHVARVNEHWRHAPVGEALVILRGPDAYVTPNWYRSKSQHGRVVPTWNYVTAHVYGELVVHDDIEWVGENVRRLTEKHEVDQPQPWAVTDAPEAFVAGQLRAVVGVELRISRIEAKAKLSQNRPPADIDGVVDGARRQGDAEMAAAVEDARPNRR
jgi:transcriptional regulator